MPTTQPRTPAVIADSLFPVAPITNCDLVPCPVVVNIFQTFNLDRNTPEFIPELSRDSSRDPHREKRPDPRGSLTRSSRLSRPPSTLFNDCLGALTFTNSWKRARLVLIRKGPEKPPDVPSSYRQICMLDTSGKLLKRLLLQRLEEHYSNRSSPYHHGHVPSLSTHFPTDGN